MTSVSYVQLYSALLLPVLKIMLSNHKSIFSLIKKEGVYDNENGKKYEYDDNGQIRAEYYLLNGKRFRFYISIE